MAEDKINRFAVDPKKKASYKTRRFLGILTGSYPSTTITYEMVAQIVSTYTPERIQSARKTFKGHKRASKYLRAFCKELGVDKGDTLERYIAEDALAQAKKCRPEEYKRIKAKLRGMTYEDK
jgi:hypothetical protein